MDYIPVIDLGGITGNPLHPSNNNETELVIPEYDFAKWQRVAEEIRKALSGIGFMYLKNHGVSQKVVRIQTLSQLCRQLPPAKADRNVNTRVFF